MNTTLGCLALAVTVVLNHGCAGEDPGCVASPLSMHNYVAKDDFVGTWRHVAYLGAIDGDLELEAGSETPAQQLSWTITEDLLFAEDESAEEPQLGFHIAGHSTLGVTSVGTVCRIETEGEWFERDHFRVDWSRDYIAAEASIPGASAVDTSEWLVEPVTYFVEPGDLLLFGPDFVSDSTGRLQSFFFPLKYLVHPCDECEPSVVSVVHRFERQD